MQPRFNPDFYWRRYSQALAPRPVRIRLGALAGLDAGTIAQFAQNAGFTGSDLQTAVAIALAESDPPGNPDSYNPETNAPGGTPVGQGSYGLWQIYLKKHPEFRGQNLLDPQTNANAAYSIFSRSGFSAWSTYNSGKYLAYMPASSAPGPAPAPITIDASTGLPIDDSTPTPAVTVQQASFFGGASSATVGTIAAGLGLLALYDLLSD
jgi:Lysozyme like domain